MFPTGTFLNKSLDPLPTLGDFKDFDIDLSVQGAAGNH